MHVRVTADVGENLALAIWDAETWDTLCPPVEMFFFKPMRWRLPDLHDKGTMRSYMQSIQVSTFKAGSHLVQSKYKVDVIYYEQPTYMEGAVATERGGSLVKLSMAAGAVAAIAARLQAKEARPWLWCEPVSIAKWKGTVKKEVIQQRILKRIPNAAEYCTNEHLWDTFGLGLYLKGFL